MAGNTFGHVFAVTTFGESHGPALGCVIDGCPPGLAIDEAFIQRALDRRRPATSRHVSQRREADRVEILSGVYEGLTLGTPIALLIRNCDARSQDYDALQHTFRPGHADYTYWRKYGHRDHRGGGRGSARETVARVAAGAIAQRWLAEYTSIRVNACLIQLGDKNIPFRSWEETASNPFFAPNTGFSSILSDYLDEIRAQRDSIGARIWAVAEGVPAGWGCPVFDRLDAEIASAMMGIPAVKGVEIGDGFSVAAQRGSEHVDSLTPEGFLSNHAGGILGGISTGQPIQLSVAVKPTSSIPQPLASIDTAGHATLLRTTGRHDPCVGIRAVPVVEAMLSLVLVDQALRHRAQNAAVWTSTPGIPAHSA